MNTFTSASSSASRTPPTKPRRRYVVATVRTLMGLAFLVFGSNAFLNFIPQPTTPLPEGAVAFVTALMATGYMMQLIGVTHLVAGAFLLTNRFVPLALVLLAPFLLHSFLFHLFLESSGLGMSALFCALELYLAWSYRSAYGPLLSPRSTSA